jgi:hypothetical protein
MKLRDRAKHKGRKAQGSFTLIPHAVQDSPNWHACGGSAIKLLCDLARQYRGSNNGDLCASMSILKPKGWTSPETVNFALRELRHYGLSTESASRLATESVPKMPVSTRTTTTESVHLYTYTKGLLAAAPLATLRILPCAPQHA